MIKPESREHALKCANSAAALCVLRTLAEDPSSAHERAVTAMAYAILSGAQLLRPLEPRVRADVRALFEEAGVERADAEQLRVLDVYLEVMAPTEDAPPKVCSEPEDAPKDELEQAPVQDSKGDGEHRNGPIRRDPKGRWFYGDMQFGLGEKHDADALQRAVGLYRDGAVPDFEPWTAPASQCSLPFPNEAPPLVEVDRVKTVHQAHGELFPALNDGPFCPVCQRVARRYERPFHAEMGSALVHLVIAFLEGGRKNRFLKLREVVPGNLHATKASSDVSYLTHWGLLKRHGTRRGYYLPTPAGVAFVRGRTRVPKSAWIYDGRPHYLSTQEMSILDAVGPDAKIRSLVRGIVGYEEP